MNENAPTEKQLLMPREKPRSAVISVGYRLRYLSSILFGRKRMMRFFLTASWLFWRFAFELTGETYGGDFHCHAKGLSEDILKRWIPAGGSLIDIGCNTGVWCRKAAQYAGTVVGIDFREDHIKQAREQTVEKNVEFVVGDATKDLPGRRFDVALLTHVLEHIDDPDSFLRSLQKIASRVIIEVPDFENDPLNWVRWKNDLRFYSDADHVREYTEDILLEQLERNGWRVLEHRKHGGALLAVAEHSA